ncbi:hypothetical protein BIV60_04755 [Bacillus sp. MUM 116]|uniref:DUF6056 family protein n=1 Tax=Bacillus sp. MUM 116 TaxID=1678002 RepID=UPI0008F58300|nr:DUF6056 family protein [Bacillus sp. MUM 116]OIK16329.1 hypothetical protein BIV60_04755 [Bacillus sp. MUM 116]
MSSKINKNGRGFIFLFFIVVFIFYLYLAYRTPLTHDDWTWGTNEGIDRIKNWFKDYNGRYMGNLTEIYLTRVYLKRIFIMALFSTLLVFLTANRTKVNSKFNYFFSFLLFLSVPVNMISQTYAWVAGFSNYITSIVFVLIYLEIVKNIFEDELPKYPIWKSLIVIPLGFITVLFVEHVSIYTVIMALYIIIFSFIKYRKVFLLHFLYFISVIIGAVIMFSNSAYSKIVSGNDQYRSIDTTTANVGLFQKISDVYSHQMYPFLFSNNVILNIFISIFCVILLVKHKETMGILKKSLQFILLFIFMVYPFYRPLALDTFHLNFFEIYPNGVEAIFTIIFFAGIILTVLFFTELHSFKHKMLFYLFSAVLLAGPLIFAQPFGPRCFIASYTFFTMFIIEIGVYIKNKNYFNLSSLNKLFAIASLFLAVCYIYVFTMNSMVHNERIHYIHQQVAKNHKKVILTRLPYPQFLQMSTPMIPSVQYDTFKTFYRIPADTELKIIPYTKWQNMNH